LTHGSAWAKLDFPIGEVAEWLNAPVSKTGLPKGSGSSNLPLSVSSGRDLRMAEKIKAYSTN
jgi:hypothetical protein